jgi:hypothetical protein
MGLDTIYLLKRSKSLQLSLDGLSSHFRPRGCKLREVQLQLRVLHTFRQAGALGSPLQVFARIFVHGGNLMIVVCGDRVFSSGRFLSPNLGLPDLRSICSTWRENMYCAGRCRSSEMSGPIGPSVLTPFSARRSACSAPIRAKTLSF